MPIRSEHGSFLFFIYERATDMTRTSGWKMLSAGVLCLAAPVAVQTAGAQSPRVREVVEKQGDVVFRLVQETADDVADPSSLVGRIALLTDAAQPSEYWLGIGLDTLPDVARQQLGIENGLVVADVMDGSPAAKAEFKKNDILVKAGGAELKEPADLIKIVDASKGKEITIVVVRGGKDRTIKVAPVKRSDEQARVEKGRYESHGKSELREESIKVLEEALRNLKDKTGDGAFGLWFPKPAVVAPKMETRGALDIIKDIRGEFPKDLSVRITKEGEQPTKVRVKRGDQEWEVTEDKLSELPDDVRPHVQKLLGRMLAPGLSAAANKILRIQPGGKVEGEIRFAPLPPTPPTPPTSPKPPTAAVPPTPPTPPQVARLHAYRVESGGVEAKLDSIMKKLDQLSKEVDELRGRSSSDKK
jgi:PDZ domain